MRVCVARSVALASALASLFSLPLATRADAQGALFLALPFGARAVARAESAVADSGMGTEAIWWNPAALARLPKQELAVHHAATFAATSDMVVYARPSRALGSLAGSAYIVNYGDQDATDIAGNVVGRVTNRSYLFSLAYATPVGKGLSLGLAYKFVMLAFKCEGPTCGPQDRLEGSTSALDVGAQYRLPTKLPVTLGASMRNAGPKLQLKDKDQSDPLPLITQVGAKSRIPVAALTEANASLDVSADVQVGDAYGGTTQAVSASLGYREQLFLTGGYRRTPDGLGGPAFGFSIQRGNLFLDLAQRYDRTIAEGDSPVFISLRVRF